jgi:ribosome biogenesis GTPase
MNLKRLGWHDDFNINLIENQNIGRIGAVFQNKFKVFCENKEIIADLKGKLIFENDFPVIGDWVILKDNLIIDILPRKTKLSRKVAGKEIKEQIIASNIDYIFIVSSLNNDFNLSRLERYLTMVWESKATPVFVLTKSDIADDIDNKILSLENISFGVPIHIISNYNNTGINELYQYFENNKTIVLIGSSGVGKSTLINKLLGEDVLKTNGLRNDDKGRHTTTHRELFLLKDSGIIIDTPGIREIQLWNGNLDNTFQDIEDLSQNCKFKDCQHIHEPGCAVKHAIEIGTLDKKRLLNYHKLKKELSYDGMNFKQLEKTKIKNMTGSLKAMKQIRKISKNKH